MEAAADKAKRFDLIILKRQVAQLTGDAATAEKSKRQVQEIAEILLTKANIAMVTEQAPLLESLLSDEWWEGVSPSSLEVVRKRIHGLMQLIEPTTRARLYTDFTDENSAAVEVELPGTTPGTDFERFRAQTLSYLRSHEDNLSLQRLLRNKPLTQDDLTSLEGMLVQAGGTRTDLHWADEHSGGLGLFIRSLVGLDRSAAKEAFAQLLNRGGFNVIQIRFIDLMVDELTHTGIMEPGRLFEAPFTDTAPTGPTSIFPEQDVAEIVTILRDVKRRAQPLGSGSATA